MGVNHGGFHVLMSQQFLNGAYVIARFKQMRCERMPEGVAGSPLFLSVFLSVIIVKRSLKINLFAKRRKKVLFSHF